MTIRKWTLRLSLLVLLAPLGACGSGGTDPATFLPGSVSQADFAYLVEKLNGIRQGRGLPLFTADAALNTFAQESVNQYAASGSPPTAPHAYFNSQAGNLAAHGFGGSAAENQGWANEGLAANRAHIDRIIDGMMAEETQFPPNDPNRGHFETIVNPIHTRVGSGLVKDGSNFWLANEFSN